jgi:leader peptidase (prepilin peptidase) / N-methyltransferase
VGGALFNLPGVFTDLGPRCSARRRLPRAVARVLGLQASTGKEGMGYGDFKLLAAIGAWLGWQMLPLVILLSSLVGRVVGIALIVFARPERSVPIPFGPYLAARRPDRAVPRRGDQQALPRFF